MEIKEFKESRKSIKSKLLGEIIEAENNLSQIKSDLAEINISLKREKATKIKYRIELKETYIQILRRPTQMM